MAIFFMRTILVVTLLHSQLVIASEQVDATQLIKNAINHYRDVSSYSEAAMTIHRSDWQRTMSMKIWTQGLDKSLVRITSPAKDKGNGSLLIGDEMWSYTPRINRVIKIPPSMAHQSWMGSDFSNNDVARADDIIEQYDHTLLDTRSENGVKTYVIQSIPHEDAPVVWGKEIIRVRDDNVVLEHNFYDQDGVLVKKLETYDIKTMDGKNVATRERMFKVETPGEWTEFKLEKIKFNVTMDKNTFTLSNLRNPRN